MTRPIPPVTPRQRALLTRLQQETQTTLDLDALNVVTASQAIGELLRLPKVGDASAAADPVTTPGMYRHAGHIYKVQRARTSGHLYAQRLTPIGGERLTTDGQVVGWEFQYAPGSFRSLRAGERMTLAEAREFGIQYGVCCVCGARLKDATSVAAGIGPVCAKRV